MPDELTLTEADVASGFRVDRLASLLFVNLGSRSAARKAIRAGRLLMDGRPVESSRFPLAGAVLTLMPDPSAPPANRLTPEVVYMDDHLAVVVKPAGILTNGNRHRTLENGLPNVLPWVPGGLVRPRPVHRLDFETTGLVVVARTAAALRDLSARFAERRVRKRYRAIVVGLLSGCGQIEMPLDDREATSRWIALRSFRSLKVGWCTRVELEPVTGRTHQLRRHLAGIHHSVLGDRKYPSGPVFKGSGLFLASTELSFEHPTTGALVSAVWDPPPKYDSFENREVRRWNRWHSP